MILKEDNRIERIYLGKEYRDVMEIPHLIEIQLESYENFLQRKKLDEGGKPQMQGLESVFQSTFPIESPNGELVLEYCGYTTFYYFYFFFFSFLHLVMGLQ